MIKKIHINQHHIRSNSKHNTDLPVMTVKTYKENIKGNSVTINGASTVIYSPDKPLSCGAKVWIETDAEVRVYNMETKLRESNFTKTVIIERIIE